MIYRSGLKVAPSAARLQLELDRLSWSAGCGDRMEGWENGPAHSKWPGNVLENTKLTMKIWIVFYLSMQKSSKS